MKSHPISNSPLFLWFILLSFLIIISCAKDNDIFENTVLEKSETLLEESEKSNSDNENEAEVEENNQEEVISAEEVIDVMALETYETRTTIFPPINDAYLQDNKGYNQNIVRLEEGRRTSYLMFDLSPIDSIGGTIDSSNLEFTVDSDDGNGSIAVFKSLSNDWSEEELSAKTAPETEILAGELSSQFKIGQTYEVELDTSSITTEVTTLILVQEEGNDLAFASKENPKGNGPALVVSYLAPQDAEVIVLHGTVKTDSQVDTPDDTTEESVITEEMDQEENGEASSDEKDQEDLAAEEENEATEENASNEENQNEETSEDKEEEATEEESQEEATTENQSDDNEKENSGDENQNNSSDQEEDEETERENYSESDAPINEPPTAVAEASPTNGDIPLKVNFTGSNSNDDQYIKSYVWDFRDGSTSTEPNPTHTFEKTGTLEVRLTVTDEEGESETDYVTITIKEKANEAPTAVAKASVASGEAPLKVQFDAEDSSDDNEIKIYRWDFKDGTTTGNKNPSHSFDNAGSYEVKLTVTDEDGLKDSETVTINVDKSENEAPVAVAGGSILIGNAPLNVEFNAWNSTDDKKIVEYSWDFKDGNSTTNKNPLHTFVEAGNYNVELSVKDEEGLTHTTTIEVAVNSKPTDSSGPEDNVDDTSSDGGSSTGGDNGNSSGSGNGGSSSGDYPSNAVFASDFGFRSGDATDAFVAAIRSGSSYVVIDKQSSDWVIRSTRFYDLKNMTIVFEPGVTLRAKPGAFGRGETLFELTRARNVTVEGTGATFRMNKGEYTDGEQRHGFEINVCNDVTVRGLTVRETGGAGIMISGDGSAGYSQNITLENIKSLNNRRDGLSFASAQDVWVRNSEFSGSSGTRPEAGVVLEPDNARDRLSNINFINCKFSDNRSAGFHFSAVDMNGSSPPISVKVVDSEFSNNAISPPSGFRRTEVEIGGGKGTNVVGGEIRFDRVKFNGSRGQIMFTRKSADGFKVAFKDCEARNVVTSVSEPPISLEANEIRSTLGGIEFDNFYIQYNKDVPFMKIQAPDKGGNFRVKDVRGSFTIKEPGDNPLTYLGSYRHNTDRNVNVSIKYKHL